MTTPGGGEITPNVAPSTDATGLAATLAAVARQAAEEAVRRAPVPTFRPGTSRGGDPGRGTCLVVLDGDDVELEFPCLVALPPPSVRVMVALTPPSSGFVVGWINGNQTVPVGTVVAFASPDPPAGWLLCNGTNVIKAQYPALYAVLGVTFGGTLTGSTFGLPDLRGRTIVSPSGTSGRSPLTALGQGGGVSSVALSVANLPSHSHGLTQFKFTAGGVSTVRILTDGTGAGISQTTDPAGSGTAHENMQPSLALFHVIKA